MNHIKSYHDLLGEKRRLEAALQFQKELIRQDIAALKEDLRPVQQALSTAGKMASPRTDNPLLRAGLGVAGDFLVRGAVFAGGGWLTRLIAPIVVNKITDFIIGTKKPIPMKSWIGKLFNRNGHQHNQRLV